MCLKIIFYDYKTSKSDNLDFLFWIHNLASVWYGFNTKGLDNCNCLIIDSNSELSIDFNLESSIISNSNCSFFEYVVWKNYQYQFVQI